MRKLLAKIPGVYGLLEKRLSMEVEPNVWPQLTVVSWCGANDWPQLTVVSWCGANDWPQLTVVSWCNYTLVVLTVKYSKKKTNICQSNPPP